MCIPATLLVLLVNLADGLHIVTSMLFGSLLPIFYTGFVLVGLSEYLAGKSGLFGKRFAMYKQMQRNEELE